jgi:hypothetical protein
MGERTIPGEPTREHSAGNAAAGDAELTAETGRRIRPVGAARPVVTTIGWRRAGVHRAPAGTASAAAIGRNGRLPETQLAATAFIVAAWALGAHRALGGIGEVCRGARRGQANGMIDAGNDATPETVASIRRQFAARVDASLRLLGGAVVESGVVHALSGVGVCRIAFQVPVTPVVAHSGIAIEEAILLAGIHVVAGDAGRQRRLVVVQGADAIGIDKVDPPVAVVVQTIAALSVAGRDRSACPGGSTAGSPGAARAADTAAGRGAPGRGVPSSIAAGRCPAAPRAPARSRTAAGRPHTAITSGPAVGGSRSRGPTARAQNQPTGQYQGPSRRTCHLFWPFLAARQHGSTAVPPLWCVQAWHRRVPART